MTTHSGRQYSNLSIVATVTMTSSAPPVNLNPHKWSYSESFSCFDLSNIQGGLYDLPKDANSWLPFFSGKGIPGNSHWTQFCDNFDFHLAGQDHPDVFMRLFASSLVEDAKVWIDRCIKNLEELQKAFKIRWCDSEHSQDSFSQYLSICKGSCESVRDFSDRFNLLLKRVQSKVASEQAIIDHLLSSLEGTLQFNVKDRSPTILEEAQDLAFQIERNLDFEDYIHQRDLSQNCELWDLCNEPIVEPEPPRILQVELAPTKRKWSLSHESIIPSQEPPLKKTHPEDEVEVTLPENVEQNPLEDFSLFIHQVGHPVSKVCELTPFYVTLQVKDSLLRNCFLHPSATTNMMTEEVMYQLGLSLSQTNTRGDFAKGVINNLEVTFDSCPSAPFLINVVIIDAVNNLGIILHKDLVEHLNGSIHKQ
jgi:hypothetical protein